MQTRLKQVIYVSEKTDTSSDSLTDIYDISQKNNLESGISGCLLIGSNSYLQLLEGPDSAVENLYSKIKMDSRHKKVKKLFEQHTNAIEKLNTRFENDYIANNFMVAHSYCLFLAIKQGLYWHYL